MARLDRWSINSDITRKPRNTDDFAMRFAAGKVRPYDDEYASISVGPASWVNHRGKEINGTRFTHYATDIAYLSDDGLTMWISSENWSAMTSKVLSSLRGAAHGYGFRETNWAIRKHVGARYYSGRVEFVMYRRTAKQRDAAAIDYVRHYKTHGRSSWTGWSDPYEMREIEVTDSSQTWYKVLDKNGCAKDGGSFQYDLPVNGEPGEWTAVIEPSLCHRGYHATTKPWRWGASYHENRVFEIEFSGTGLSHQGDDKAVFPSIRLVRELSRKEINELCEEVYA